MIVVDANIVAYFWLPSPYTEQVSELAKHEGVWITPELCRSEFRNILAAYIRRKIISGEEAALICNQMEISLTDSFRPVRSGDVLELLLSSACSSYDCEYVALAKTFSLPLVTYDKLLLREFPGIAVNPHDYIKRTSS
jgi:predicted nucleic acid-binding protein